MSAINERVSQETLDKIIEAADEVITALAGTNEDVHKNDSAKMCQLWDDLNDRYATPAIVKALAAEIKQYRAAAEPVVSDSMALAFHAAITDSAAGADDIEEIKTGLRAALANYAAPQVTSVPDDYFTSLVSAARARADKAMRKFPQPNYVLNKVAEENGEVIKAVIHYTEGRETWINVEGEIIDNLAMLIRLVQEGDQVIGFTPPNACRAAMLTAAPAVQAEQLSGNTEQVEPVTTNYTVPDGYALVPVEPTQAMLDEFDSIIDYGAEDSKDAWRRLIAAAQSAPQQEVLYTCPACHQQSYEDMGYGALRCADCGRRFTSRHGE